VLIDSNRFASFGHQRNGEIWKSDFAEGTLLPDKFLEIGQQTIENSKCILQFNDQVLLIGTKEGNITGYNVKESQGKSMKILGS